MWEKTVLIVVQASEGCFKQSPYCKSVSLIHIYYQSTGPLLWLESIILKSLIYTYFNANK